MDSNFSLSHWKVIPRKNDGFLGEDDMFNKKYTICTCFIYNFLSTKDIFQVVEIVLLHCMKISFLSSFRCVT